MSENLNLPKDWAEAHPVLTAFMNGSLARRSEIDTKIDGLKSHIDDRFDQLSSQMSETQIVSKEHSETLRQHGGELHRLHDQQTNVLSMVNSTLTSFGKILGDLHEKAYKADIVRAVMVVCVGAAMILLTAVAWKVFHTDPGRQVPSSYTPPAGIKG